MKESTLRGIVVTTLKKHSAFAVENRVHDGTPDVCSTLGFIECKCIASWPARETSMVGVDVRHSQRLWLRRWAHCKGSALVLTVACGEWFVHDGGWSAENLARATQLEMREHALRIWPSRPTDTNLRQELERLHGREI